MEQLMIKNLYDLEQTIAADLFEGATYPWELLSKIGDYIVELGNKLPADKYEKRGENIWIAKSAKVAPTACLNGPCIIDEDAEIRHCAFVRGIRKFFMYIDPVLESDDYLQHDIKLNPDASDL